MFLKDGTACGAENRLYKIKDKSRTIRSEGRIRSHCDRSLLSSSQARALLDKYSPHGHHSPGP